MSQVDPYAELRAGVRSVVTQFDSRYWQELDEARAFPEKFVTALTEAGWLSGLIPEEYGGTTMFIDVSAKQGLGINELLEAVLLTADASLDLRANPNQDAQGVAIEAHLDRGRGPGYLNTSAAEGS